MGLHKGQTNNPNGRPKGTANKTTIEIKELLIQFIGGNLNDLQKNYDELEPEKKLQFFERVLKYVIPQQKEMNQVIDVANLSEKELDLLIEKIMQDEV
ncbi:MAG: hypothetical protein U5L09_07850 [Bacteroidales bacterium]|nr:hypothetical protein [Bacteroidales bacterium]